MQQQPRLHRRDFLPSISRPLTKATTAKLFPSDKLQFVDSLFRTNDKLKLVEHLCALRFFLRAHLIHHDRQIARDRLNHSHQPLRLNINQEEHF